MNRIVGDFISKIKYMIMLNLADKAYLGKRYNLRKLKATITKYFSPFRIFYTLDYTNFVLSVQNMIQF